MRNLAPSWEGEEMNEDRPARVIERIVGLNKELSQVEHRIMRPIRTKPGQQPSERRVANRTAARDNLARKLAHMI